MGKMSMPSFTVRYNGLFDFDGMYSAIISWAKNYGYMWHENTYKHKVPSPEGAEMEWLWTMDKNVTQYISHRILITVHSWELRDVEVEIDSKKKTLTNARIYIKVDGTLKWDWQGKFGGKSRFAKWVGKAYESVYSKELSGPIWDSFYYRLWNFQALLKKYFNMQSKKYAYKGYLGEH